MGYTSSCHCGAVKATIEGDPPGEAMSCNCSICRRRGHLLHFVPIDQAKLEADEGALGDYTFNHHVIHHRFCQTCGCGPYGTGKGPDGKEMVAVNLRCVPECNIDALKINAFDGASK